MKGPRIAVGAVIVRDDELLMVKRGNHPGKGLWSLPGGRVEAREYLADALRREVAEETGLEVTVGELVGIFEVVGDPHYVVLDFFARAEKEGHAVAAASDVEEVRWVPLERVADLECTPRFIETLRGWGILT
ncbi:MAG: NUDIX domain-containing protein [Actinomycetota bacterium]|nr:NUDIX domain-containing protein [Actinomycetota bacterium]